MAGHPAIASRSMVIPDPAVTFRQTSLVSEGAAQVEASI
jgi:hypothetical protein